jgi:hypothetical protein
MYLLLVDEPLISLGTSAPTAAWRGASGGRRSRGERGQPASYEARELQAGALALLGLAPMIRSIAQSKFVYSRKKEYSIRGTVRAIYSPVHLRLCPKRTRRTSSCFRPDRTRNMLQRSSPNNMEHRVHESLRRCNL